MIRLVLAFVMCTLLLSCDSPTVNVDTAPEPDTLLFNAEYFIDDVLAQNQRYSLVIDSQDVMEYREVGEFISNPSILATAFIRLVNDQYDVIEIAFDNGNLVVNLSISRNDDRGQYLIELDDTLVDSLSIESNLILFEGPNPMFDYINAMNLIGMESGEKKEQLVYVISWVDGRLITETQTFQRTNDTITINKPETRRNAELELHEDFPIISRYRQVTSRNEEHYNFTTTE